MLYNPSKSLPVFIENPNLLKNHRMIGSHEVETSTLDLGGGYEPGAPGGIVEIAHNIAAPVAGIVRDHANDLNIMVAIAINPACQMANLAWQWTKKYSLLRKW
jgi:hypothetical protein